MNQYLRRKIWTLNRSGKFRGYLRTVLGYPVTLTDCMAGQPVSMAVDGNAVQDGTPSPDAPVEVQLCGDKTGNLLSIIDANPNTIPVKSYSNGIIEVIGEVSLSGGRTNRLSDYITLETNQTYTMVSYLVAGQTDSDIYVCLSRREDGTIYKNIGISAEKRFITIAPDENVELYLGINVAQGNHNSTLRVAIYKGSYTAETMPAYEPYGYKVPLTIECGNLYTGELLFKPAGVSIEQIPSGYRFFYENGTGNFRHACYKCHNVKPYTAYTAQINVKVNSFSEDTRFVFRAFENKNVSDYLKTLKEYMTTYSKLGIGEIKDITIKFNTKECTDIYLQTNFSWLESSKFDVEITDIKLTEDGITPQTFNIYTPQQLAKVGDTADTVVLDFDNKTAELRKNVGSMILDGNESWTGEYMLADSTNRYTIQNELRDTYSASRGFCDRLPKVVVPVWAHNNVEGFLLNSTQIHLSLLNTDLGVTEEDDSSSRTQKFKEFLSTHQATVYAPLATPVTTDITSLQQWDAMPLLRSGTAVITADTVIAPSAITAKYYASKPEEVN